MINPIKPNTGLWISLNMNYHCYSPKTLKRHCRCNHTLVLLCRIFCANYATSTAIHMENETPFPVHSCVNPTWTKTALRKWIQFAWKRNCSNHKFHLDTETSRLLIANWFHQDILTTKHTKISHLPTDWRLLTIRFCGSLWRFCDCGVTITVLLCNYVLLRVQCPSAVWIGWGLFNAMCS